MLMASLFLSIGISNFTDAETGELDTAYADSIKRIAASLRRQNLEVSYPLEADQPVSDSSTKAVVEADLARIRNATATLALIYSSDISAGQQFELCYASGLGKKIFIAAPKDTELLFMNRGMVDLGLITRLTYTDPDELAREIAKLT